MTRGRVAATVVVAVLAVGAVLVTAVLVTAGVLPPSDDEAPTARGVTGTPAPTSSTLPDASSPSTSARPEGFTLRDPRIAESSGLARSARHPHTVWTVNDSGDSARIFAVDTGTGETVGLHEFAADVRDVEALAVTPQGRVLVADIGDNDASRASIRVHVFDEPDLGDTSGPATTWELTYPDGAHDAEALAVDPADGRILVVTKAATGGVYVLPADVADAGRHRLEKVGTVSARVTDAVFLPTGLLAVRTYTSLLLLDPHTYAVRATTLLPLQRQGETLALPPDTADRTDTPPALLVGSEGEGSTVRVVMAPDPA